jgi:hypothetical protein
MEIVNYKKRIKRLRFDSFPAPDARREAAYFLCASVRIPAGGIS